MAQITVNEVVTDSDFQDQVVVIRRKGSVSDEGELTTETQRIPISAVIQSASSDQMVLLTDLQRASGVIEVITTFPLRGQSNRGPPDMVIWRNRAWECATIDNFLNYASGAGHIEAMATLTDLEVGPP